MTRAIGIDIGGTKIAIGAVAANGQLHSQLSIPTESDRPFSEALPRIIEGIESVLRQTGWEPASISGIGIGCAGPVDPVAGVINNPYTLPGWNGSNIMQPLRERFRVPVLVENDAEFAWRFLAMTPA